jgi:hypothetical protein
MELFPAIQIMVVVERSYGITMAASWRELAIFFHRWWMQKGQRF